MLTMDVLDFTQDAQAIGDADQLIERLLRETRKVGLDFVAVSGGYAANGPSEDQMIHTGLPQDWTNYYFDQGYVRLDPAYKRSLGSLLPFQWTDVTDLPTLTRPERLVMDEADAAGLKNGIVVPIHGPKNYAGFVSLAGQPDRFAPQVPLDLQVMAIHFHHRLRDLLKEAGRPRQDGPMLTPREAECLVWLAEGKSDWEIGEILTVSHHTVKTHVERIKRKFGVRTRVQAVVEAIRTGQIDP